uniref:Uncharacterized protein n=2 Tax=Oryza sativa subsp. japonica TaxID=39947 RepID=Q5ZA45_ORYSJ|nr:hypothetical protein [Oryza sativa Japonica Group]
MSSMQAPFFVATRMVENLVEARRLSPFTATPGAYARAAVGWIGRGGPLCTPSVRHQLLWCAAAAAAPDFVLDWILLRSHLEQRTLLSADQSIEGAISVFAAQS